MYASTSGAFSMRTISLLLCCLLALLCGTMSVFAVNGEAKGVDQGAAAQLGANTRVLTVGSDLAIGETVVTDANGQVQIRFADKTELVVGPNSALTLEDYLLRGDGSAGKFAINALAGTFRFVTGTAAKSRYQIDTPTGTIGVRGTAFDFTVSKKKTDVLLYHGAAILCSTSRDCVTLDNSCEVGTYERNDSEVLGLTKKLQRNVQSKMFDSFRYASNQRPLREDFRVPQARNCFSKTQAELLPPKVKVPDAVDPCADPAACVPPPPPPLESCETTGTCPPPDSCETAGTCPAPDDGGGGGCEVTNSCGGGEDHGDDDGDDSHGDEGDHGDNGHHQGDDHDGHHDEGFGDHGGGNGHGDGNSGHHD
jgi:hypothetical protein